MRREAKVTHPQAFCICLPHDTAVITHCFNISNFFGGLCFILSSMMAKSSKCLYQVLHEATHWNVLWGFRRTVLKPDSGFLMLFMFHGRRVIVEDDWRSWRPSTRKTTENFEKFWELILKNRCWAISILADTIVIKVCQEILNRKYEHVPHCCEDCLQILDKW
jgi:hypothetical protein